MGGLRVEEGERAVLDVGSSPFAAEVCVCLESAVLAAAVGSAGWEDIVGELQVDHIAALHSVHRSVEAEAGTAVLAALAQATVGVDERDLVVGWAAVLAGPEEMARDVGTEGHCILRWEVGVAGTAAAEAGLGVGSAKRRSVVMRRV